LVTERIKLKKKALRCKVGSTSLNKENISIPYSTFEEINWFELCVIKKTIYANQIYLRYNLNHFKGRTTLE